MAAACRWPSPSKAPMCLTRNWLPPHSTPSRSSAPIPLPKSRSIFASIKAIPANRLTAKPANAAIRLTFPARPTKPQSRSIVGSLGGGKLNALIPGSTAPGGYSSAGKKRSPITWASCIFNSPSSLYEPRRFSDRLLMSCRARLASARSYVVTWGRSEIDAASARSSRPSSRVLAVTDCRHFS